MLDTQLMQQLSQHFQSLGAPIELVVQRSDHPQQGELLELLTQVASTSPQLALQRSATPAEVPTFAVHRGREPTGIRFRGVPGGHEFSSLVLAILNAGGQGKLPDPGLTRRIRALPSGVELRTYVSLSCENCPDVVQALNQVALVHGDLTHTMVDGALVESEVQELGLQGVPSVVVGDALLHSGRATLAELLAQLEGRLGQPALPAEPTDLGRFDVAVVGGGPAGVSAAIYSARKGLRTALLAERLGGQVQETKGIENLISVIYTEGPALSSSLEQHVRHYNIDVLEHRRVQHLTPAEEGTGYRLGLDSNEHLQAERVIVATGARWRELGVPGEKEYIGRGVAFCPHCDGPYYKGKRVAVVGGGNSGVEAAIDLAGLCSDVVVLEFMDTLRADSVLVDRLKSLPNVRIVTLAKTTEVLGDGERVVGLNYEDRVSGQSQRLDLDGVFVQIGLSPNSGLVKDQVETTRFGEIVVDAQGRTSLPGIYAAGDVTTVPYKQIVIAMGEGAKVALAAFEDSIRSRPAAA